MFLAVVTWCDVHPALEKGADGVIMCGCHPETAITAPVTITQEDV